MRKIYINIIVVLGILLNYPALAVNASTGYANTPHQGTVYGDTATCAIETSTIADCFTDLVWAHAVAKKVGAAKVGTWLPDGSVTVIPQYDVDIVFTQAMANAVTFIDGNKDVAAFVYKNAEGVSFMPKMDGLAIFTNLKKIYNFGTSSSSAFGNVKWTNEGITDFNKWAEAKSLESITFIFFTYGFLTAVDLGDWGYLPALKKLVNIAFSNNQLTDMSNIENWKHAKNLEELSAIYFHYNQLTDVGDLGNWHELDNLKKLNGIYFSDNALTTVGDLGKWGQLKSIETMDIINFSNNQLTSIGDLGKWDASTTLQKIDGFSAEKNLLTSIGDLGTWHTIESLTKISGLNFRRNKLTVIGKLSDWSKSSSLSTVERLYFENNQLTDIGDLGEWSNLTNLTTIYGLYFQNNKITSIGDLGKWSNLTNLTRIEYVNFERNLLTDIGNLGEWGKLAKLTKITSINFSSNRLTDIGDLGEWSALQALTELKYLSFNSNGLKHIGDLGEWSKLTNLNTFGAIIFFGNQLTDIGNIGRWKTLSKLTALESIDFSHNQLTDVGDLGEWSALENLVFLDTLNFNNNRLTSVGDLGKWGDLPKLTKLYYLRFYNNQLTTIGDLSNWKKLDKLIVFQGHNFSYNKLTDIGDLSEWKNIPNIETLIKSIDFSNNHLETVSIDDTFAALPFPINPSVFNFNNQLYTKETQYLNKSGLNSANSILLTLPAHNAFNHNSGIFGTYTLAPDVSEVYRDKLNNIVPIVDETLTIPVQVGATEATYTLEQKNHIPLTYSSTISHLLAWVELDIQATDFTISLTELSEQLITPADALKFANTLVHFIDETGAVQEVSATVNQTELDTIRAATATGTFPLTFTYRYHDVVVSKTITVSVDDTIDTLHIEAADFTIELKDVNLLTSNTAMTSAQVAAHNETTGLDISEHVIVDAAELATIKTTAATAVFPLTFTIEDNGSVATTTIQVTVINTPILPDTVTIDAHDFSIELQALDTLTATVTLDAAKASAYNETTEIDITDNILVDSNELNTITATTIADTFPLTFTVEDNGGIATTTIQVTVLDTPVLPDIVTIDAHDFSIELQALDTLTATVALDIAKVSAYNETTAEDITTAVTLDVTELATIQATQLADTFPLTFSVEDNGTAAHTIILVTVLDTPIIPDTLSIEAYDFSIELVDVSTLTSDKSIILAHASALNESTHSDLTDSITADEVELKAIQSATSIHSYPLTFTAYENGASISKTIDVIILDTPILPDTLSITAAPFTINLANIDTLTPKQAIYLAQVLAFNETTNKDITKQATVDDAQLAAILAAETADSFPLTFLVVDNGVSTSTTILVSTLADPELPNVLSIQANDFTITLAAAPSLTSLEVLTKSQVIAKNETTNTDITDTVSVDSLNLLAVQETQEAGTYPVKLTIEDNGVTATTTIQVNVFDIPAIPDNLSIVAEDFSISLADVSTLTSKDAINFAQVAATNETTATDITQDVTINTDELITLQAATIADSFPLTFTVTDAITTAEKSISVHVFNPADSYSIHAEDASLSILTYKKLQANGTLAAHILTITKAKVTNETTAIEVEPLVADLQNFETTDLLVGAKVAVDITYTIPTTNTKNVSNIVTTTAIITLTADPTIPNDDEHLTNPPISEMPSNSSLPITGAPTSEILFIGVITFLLGCITLYGSQKVKKSNK